MATIKKGDARNLSAGERARRKIVRDARVEEIQAARKRSRTEVREGRVFLVLRLPDRYPQRLKATGTPLLPHEMDRLAQAE